MTLNHIGLIMDGNRRYAKKHLLNPLKGHEEGTKRVKEVIEISIQNKISEISLYTFSTKNFKRTKQELNFLFKLFEEKFAELIEDETQNLQIRFAGHTKMFPENIQSKMHNLEEKTQNNTGLIVNFCMAYDGQEEIINSVKICNEKGIEPNSENIQKNLWIKTPADLIIRTSGENRISGFLLWQSSYSEFYFTNKLWPEFTKEEYQKSIDEYNKRHRRFGK